jgi:hypothetical protein
VESKCVRPVLAMSVKAVDQLAVVRN